MFMRTKRAFWLVIAAALFVLTAGSSQQANAHGLYGRANTGLASHALVNCCDACCDVNICYRHVGRRHTCCDPCLEPINTTLTVCHPCTGCTIEVPVCLPGCCTGSPTACDRGTLIGAGLTRFDWCCGFSVVVRYQRCGDITVVYRG